MSSWLTPMVSLLSAVIGAIVGGVLVHRLTLRREAIGARRTQRVDFLLGAYRRLIGASNRDMLTGQRRDDLESALSDIMLLGGPEEIEAASQFMVAMAAGEGSSLDPVIRALRDSLRRELGLDDSPLPKLHTLRLHLKDDPGVR